MKKVLGLLLSLTAVFALAACGGGETDTETPTVPTFSGIESFVTVTAGDKFDPMEGVTASDTIDGDLTSSITVTGTECLLLDDNNMTTVGPLECSLQYKVTNSNDLSALKVVTVTIEKGEPVAGDNQIVNGDFSDAAVLDVWIKAEFDGGGVIHSIVDGQLKLDIQAVSWQAASPRIHQEALTYEVGKTYVVTFDIKADTPRMMYSQVGVLLSGAPWFIPYADRQEFQITTEWQTLSYQFTVVAEGDVTDTTNGIVSFEFGTYDLEGENEEAIATIVYMDNVSVQELSD